VSWTAPKLTPEEIRKISFRIIPNYVALSGAMIFVFYDRAFPAIPSLFFFFGGEEGPRLQQNYFYSSDEY